MTHDEKRIWLIQQLLKEKPEYQTFEIPTEKQQQKNLLRALMNVRLPDPISEEILQVQDEYLSEENRLAGITDIADLAPIPSDERIYLWQGDMTALKVDAITNPANSAMLGCFQPLHSCADNIIGSKAGIRLRLRCNDIMCAQGHEEPTGQAKITPGYNLPCKYILHTVGPIVEGRLTKEHERLLASCYRSCLELADQYHLQSIAFCCISTGVFMFPNQRAAEIAVETVKKYYQETESPIKTVFNVYKDLDLEIYRRLLLSI
ncbi:MAG: protein-ADP-ribose hydrolase [Clostridia bacterium]|nr:protein-ADP-ribose hydrolase [Clostridia bacterium]